MSDQLRAHLRLRLELHSADSPDGDRQSVTPRQAQEFFELAEQLSRAIIIEEALRVLEVVEVDPGRRYELTKLMERRSSRVEAAADIVNVHDGSLHIEISISAESILIVLAAIGGAMFKESLLEAWRGSPAHERLVAVLSTAFGTSRRRVEQAAAARPKHDYDVTEVVEESSGSEVTVDLVAQGNPVKEQLGWGAAERFVADLPSMEAHQSQSAESPDR